MKTILKLSTICLPLLFAIPTQAHVNWGIDIRFGAPPPPPREVIVARPFADAIWVPGYYNRGLGHRYNWVPGFWRRHERREDFREVRNHERHEQFERDRHEDRRGGDHGDIRRGRIY